MTAKSKMKIAEKWINSCWIRNGSFWNSFPINFCFTYMIFVYKGNKIPSIYICTIRLQVNELWSGMHLY